MIGYHTLSTLIQLDIREKDRGERRIRFIGRTDPLYG